MDRPASRRLRDRAGRPRARGGLAEHLHEELEAIERAEKRVEEGTYGLSVESGRPIEDARLELIPWAERTAEEQARYEGGA